MRHLFLSIALCVACTMGGSTALHAQAFTSWNNFVAETIRILKAPGKRLVLSEDRRIFNDYVPFRFEADSKVSGYYILVLYTSKFCKEPSTYFDYGEGREKFKFETVDDGFYAYQMLKVKSHGGSTGNIYVKYNTPGESRSVRVLVIED